MKKFQKSSDYYYPNTHILVNNFDINPEFFKYQASRSSASKEELCELFLHALERKVVSVRLLELMEKPIVGNFDFEHLKNIHKFLFQDFYPWAGETRNCDIAKQDLFCRYMFIDIAAKELFEDIKRKGYFINMPFGERKYYIVKAFSDINALHPFREGNGRAQREFIESLARINGFELDLTHISQDEMIEASHRSILGDNSYLEALFDPYFIDISKEEQIEYIKTYCTDELANKLVDSLKVLKR